MFIDIRSVTQTQKRTHVKTDSGAKKSVSKPLRGSTQCVAAKCQNFSRRHQPVTSCAAIYSWYGLPRASLVGQPRLAQAKPKQNFLTFPVIFSQSLAWPSLTDCPFLIMHTEFRWQHMGVSGCRRGRTWKWAHRWWFYSPFSALSILLSLRLSSTPLLNRN